VRFYVAPQLIAAPDNLYRVTTLRATNASYFDEAMLAEVNGANVVATNTIRGDVHASSGSVAVWDSFLVVQAPASQTDLTIQSRVSAFNRRTARLLNERGAAINGNTHVHQSGIGYFWPIGLHKRNYSYFDATTERAWPMVYSGTTVARGVHAYRFVQRIPSTYVGISYSLPGYLLRLPGQSVKALEYYSSTVIAVIDPRTGVPISQEEVIRTVLRTADGTGTPLTVASMDLRMSPSSQASLASYSDDQATKITLFRVVVPIAAIVLGLVLLAVGAVLSVRGRNGTSSTEPTPAMAAPNTIVDEPK
jgi:hypothetical protein